MNPKKDFKKDFRFFLRHTNEKEVLLERLSALVDERNVSSLLDVGAGDGELAIPLSRKVSHYKAVESEPSYADALQAAGIEVTREPFPSPLGETFDMVLLSHVISYRRSSDGKERERMYTLLDSAWSHVAPGGSLVIITHRGLPDDWSALISKLGWSSGKAEMFADMLSKLETFGNVSLERLVSNLVCDSFEDTLRGLAFMAAYGRADVKALFMEKAPELFILLQPYETPSGYSFPFSQFMLEVR